MKKIITLLVGFVLLNAAKSYSQNSYTYTGKPMFNIYVTRANVAIGSFTMELFPNIAPHHTRNFDSLVSTGFYDSTAFHRVVPGFVIQGGDPNSRSGAPSTWGFGNPNQPTVNAEFSVARHLRGIVSAARSTNINSATSQFFVCVAAAANLNGLYSVYGRVTSGMSIVDNIVASPRDVNDRPLQKVAMFVTYIGSNDTVAVAPSIIAPANDSLQVDETSPIVLKWNPVSDGIIYEMQLSRNPGFTDSVAFIKTPNTSYLFNSLLPQTAYYWRVRTNNGGSTSFYTTTRRFVTTWATTGISNNSTGTKSVQVFPNPGNGKFTFSNLEKGNTVEIFDAAGKLISTGTAKDSSYLLDIEGKEKGLYSYRISNEEQTVKQGKLLLK